MNKERISSPIQESSIEQRGDELDKRLAAIQIYYAQKQFQKEKVAHPEITFGEVLNEYTAFIEQLAFLYSIPDEPSQKDTHRKELTESFIKEINSVYENESINKEEAVASYIQEKQAKAQKPEEVPCDEEYTAGIIEHALHTEPSPKMEAAGFAPDDEFLEIHFPEMYKSGVGDSLLSSIKESLIKLSEIVVERYPQAKAIVGNSWLLSLPAAQRFGFIPLKEQPEQKPKRLTGSTWKQFIDQNGNINKERLNAFIETGEPPYTSVCAYIPIKDFLQKYLPKEKRGIIKLRDTSPSYIKWEREQREGDEEKKLLEEKYNIFIKDKDMSPKKFIEQFPILKNTLQKGAILTDILLCLQQAKEKNLTFKEFGEQFEKNKDVKRKFNEYKESIEKNKYIDRNIIIE